MPLDMVYFCQPEGSINVGARKIASSIRDSSSSFVFTLTDKDSGKTRYGICVNFYRPIERATASAQHQGGGASSGAAAGQQTSAGRSSAFRRESWRKSMEKSSDSAFSRQVFLTTHDGWVIYWIWMCM